MPHTKRHLLSLCLVSGALLLTVASPVSADVTGAILGNVADSSGAAVAGAMVTLTNQSKGLHRETVTDPTGFYQILAVR